MKKIIIVLVIIILVAVIGGIVLLLKINNPSENQLETACKKSGGIVEISNCCMLVSDFPNNCAIGACGCSPEHSHEVKTCTCPDEWCWNGTKCQKAREEGLY